MRERQRLQRSNEAGIHMTRSAMSEMMASAESMVVVKERGFCGLKGGQSMQETEGSQERIYTHADGITGNSLR